MTTATVGERSVPVAQLWAVGVVLSGAAIIVGAFLPWAEIDLFGGSVSVTGMHLGGGNAGKVTVGIGVLIVLVGCCLPLFDHVGRVLLVALPGFGGLVFAVYQIIHVRATAAAAQSASSLVTVRLGVGPFVVGAACTVVLVLGLVSAGSYERALAQRAMLDRPTGETWWTDEDET